MKPSAMNAIILAKPDTADFGMWISGELARIQAIDRRIIHNHVAREKARKDFEAATKRLDDETRAIRATCPHYSVTRHTGTAGGNDSYVECDHCGKELT